MIQGETNQSVTSDFYSTLLLLEIFEKNIIIFAHTLYILLIIVEENSEWYKCCKTRLFFLDFTEYGMEIFEKMNVAKLRRRFFANTS